jgi:hypothetical protein
MGQLGNLDEGYNSNLTPHLVEKLAPRNVIKQISCGQYHTVGVTGAWPLPLHSSSWRRRFFAA